MVTIRAGDILLLARLERVRAPATVAALLRLLPLEGELLQARWSGEAAWIPLGDLSVGVGEENATDTPAPGQILLYPRGISETEILVPYGMTRFASKHGPLRGNHVMTVVEGAERLTELGERVLRRGAVRVRIAME